ncbi:hypothetical protein [Caulobacter endophyticus]|uniref:hypothetical protein n=1 Tax=Caulobacter endophyticus TaxID=2172652 RepID=UPI00240F47DB|nr:hypothetical protein [Caulobacter endophyticus]MDG2531270.1 hypothetical protein [Caulobacter endophyticus]
MAGKVQHEIPQLYQRGFLIPGTGKAERIFVFRNDAIYPSNINRSAAESFFYSELPKTNERTLDDDITEYEDKRLKGLIATLRSHTPGEIVDGEAAAEVIAHLTTRNAHIRGAFKFGLETMAVSAWEVLADEDNVRRMAGLDGPMIPDRFREIIADSLEKLPIPNRDQIPPKLLEMMLFAAAREGFSSIFASQMPQLKSMLAFMSNLAPAVVRDGHNRALSESLVPDKRAEDLSGFTWRVQESPVDLVLPDCVALAFGEDGPEPVMMASSSKKDTIVLPLTTRSALVGGRHGVAEVDLTTFNDAAARCAHAYFLAASKTPEFEALAQTIGGFTDHIIRSVVETSFDKLLRKEELEPAEPTTTPRRQPPSSSQITLIIQGEFEPDAPPKITAAVKEVLAQAAWSMGFDRLDGITIADDYAGGIANLDRGMPGVKNPVARNDEFGTGFAQSISVRRDGVIKEHVVVQSVVAHNLLSDNEADRAWAGHALANQIVHAEITDVFDEALPGILLSRTCEGLDAQRQAATYPAWMAYFAGRATAHFDPNRLDQTQELLQRALEIAYRTIPDERLAFQTHGNHARLVDKTFFAVRTVLEQAGALLGHADGAEVDPLAGCPALESDLRAKELLAWLADLRRDLVWLWDRRGRWQSYEEFLALGRHMDRLLWPHAIIPWSRGDGWDVAVP